MAQAKHNDTPAENQVSRRSLLSIAPATGLVAMLAGDATAKIQNPILALYHQHRAIIEAATQHASDGYVSDAEMDRLFYDEAGKIEEAMMAIPCATPADFAAKIIVDTACGGVHSSWETGSIWTEARALIAEALIA